jgi:hypothetical protein
MTNKESEPSSDKDERELPAYCSICGTELPNPDFALKYPNFVCDDCDSRAVNKQGDDPWHGWPPGERPESEPGTIQMAPDRGENPVYIDGIKCWRRYRFGGHITLRDAFDCDNVREFYDTHGNDDNEFTQIHNSPNPPGDCLSKDRLLVQKADKEDTIVRVWGMLSAETGEILARNAVAEEVFGPFEEFLESFEDRFPGKEEYEEALTDPTRMLSFFYSFGSQAHKPKILYLVPELDQPLAGLDAIVKTGALRGLRRNDAADSIFELGLQSVENCASFYVDGSEETKTPSESLAKFGRQESTPDVDGSTLTVRYELPYGTNSRRLQKTGVRIAQSIFRGIVIAAEGTDYTYLSSIPSADVHAYRGQQEVMTVAVDDETIKKMEWEEVSDSPSKMDDIAVAFYDRLA